MYLVGLNPSNPGHFRKWLDSWISALRSAEMYLYFVFPFMLTHMHLLRNFSIQPCLFFQKQCSLEHALYAIFLVLMHFLL